VSEVVRQEWFRLVGRVECKDDYSMKAYRVFMGKKERGKERKKCKELVES